MSNDESKTSMRSSDEADPRPMADEPFYEAVVSQDNAPPDDSQ
jgi:hypothetical protein